jgi:hypothetical protein
MRSGFAIAAACVALSLLGVPSGAQADILNLGASTSGSISFTGLGGSPPSVNVSISNLNGNGFVSATPGTYFLAAGSFTAGPETFGGAFPISGATPEVFTYAQIGGALMGQVTWNTIFNSTNPQLIGTFSGTGMGNLAGFTGTGLHIDLATTSLLPVGTTLGDLAGGSSSATVRVSSGEIEGVPAPLMGDGLPGVVAACGGLLLFLARRRRQKTA